MALRSLSLLLPEQPFEPLQLCLDLRLLLELIHRPLLRVRRPCGRLQGGEKRLGVYGPILPDRRLSQLRLGESYLFLKAENLRLCRCVGIGDLVAPGESLPGSLNISRALRFPGPSLPLLELLPQLLPPLLFELSRSYEVDHCFSALLERFTCHE